jgi:dolichol-phosphate mannosyltransferase
MKAKPEISIVVPVYNEEDNIKPFLKRIKEVLKNFKSYEILFCLDPCKDNTEKIIQQEIKNDSKISMIVFSRRFGQPAATMAGILNCKGKCCVVIDVDMQDPPELIVEMYKKYREGYDVVYAKRANRKGETLIKKIVSNIGYRIINKIANVNIPKDTGDFRIISRRVIEELRKLNENHGFLRGLVAFVGFKQTSILYNRDARFAGNGKYNRFLGSLKIGFNGIIGFSNVPLSLMLWFGFIVSLFSFIGIIYIFVAKIVFHHQYPMGIPTIIVLILFIGGIQVMSIGLLGEYVGRMYEEVRNRPRYIIDKKYNFK